MTVYSTNISTTPTDPNGRTTTSFVSERINDHSGPSFVSSEDYRDGGIPAIDGKTGDRKSVYSADDLAPDDIVNVAGIPMSVAQAKSCGYSFDGDEPIPGNNNNNTTDTENDEGEAEELDLRQEGDATDEEVVAMENLTQSVELHTGMDSAAAIELGTDILTGELSQDDPVWTALQVRGVSRDAAHGAIQQVVQVGQNAALRELGAAGYNELSRLADSSPAIKSLVVQHGARRMQGKAKGMTWGHVLTLAKQFARA